MKRILVIYYSQSGQLYDIVESIISAIRNEQIAVDYHQIQTTPDFGFPWKKEDFFDVFPETFLQKTRPVLEPKEHILNQKYDLVILAYQVWFLTPSIPITSFFKSEAAVKLLKDTPVITVSGSRNMWIMAQEKVKKLLRDNKASLVGNIALVDKHINHISVITIVRWMFTGKKKSYLGIFPKPGVSKKDIQLAGRFGNPIRKALVSSNYQNLQQDLQELGAVKIKPFLVLSDKRANVLFSKWANYIYKKGPSGDIKRKKSLKLFNYYLIVAIWVFMPIVYVIFLLTYIPFYSIIRKEKAYYSSILIKND